MGFQVLPGPLSRLPGRPHKADLPTAPKKLGIPDSTAHLRPWLPVPRIKLALLFDCHFKSMVSNLLVTLSPLGSTSLGLSKEVHFQLSRQNRAKKVPGDGEAGPQAPRRWQAPVFWDRLGSQATAAHT